MTSVWGNTTWYHNLWPISKWFKLINISHLAHTSCDIIVYANLELVQTCKCLTSCTQLHPLNCHIKELGCSNKISWNESFSNDPLYFGHLWTFMTFSIPTKNIQEWIGEGFFSFTLLSATNDNEMLKKTKSMFMGIMFRVNDCIELELTSNLNSIKLNSITF